jgi:hypothetical protein
MSSRKKAIKSAFVGGGTRPQSATNGVPFLGEIDDWTPQMDVTVMGVLINIEADVRDVDSNTDNEVKGYVDLTKAGACERPGSIASVEMQNIWNGVIAIGGGLRTQNVVMFPEGTGVDVDSAETLSLQAYFSVTGGGPIDFFGSARIYYIER